ncbi:MAG TPA: hypothetical protein VM432_07960 [Bdellovibrionales bacterium]|nr:hypothetical protein [Bdellovibrionales bacterium]
MLAQVLSSVAVLMAVSSAFAIPEMYPSADELRVREALEQRVKTECAEMKVELKQQAYIAETLRILNNESLDDQAWQRIIESEILTNSKVRILRQKIKESCPL